jgi:hypothetical protein
MRHCEGVGVALGVSEAWLPIIAPPKCVSNRGGLGDSLTRRLFVQATTPEDNTRVNEKMAILQTRTSL